MEQELLGWLSSDNGLVVHIAVLVLLLLGGIGFIPEDIPVILAGIAAGRGIVSPTRIWLTAYVGVVLADQIVYWIGYFFGPKLLDASNRSRFLPTVSPEKINEIRDGLRKRTLAIIFVGRHLFPVRSVTFLTAGALRIPYLEFLIADALAALVSVSLVFALGYYLGEHLSPEIIGHVLKKAHLYIAGICSIGLAFYLLKRRRKAQRLGLAGEYSTQGESEINDQTEIAGRK